MEINKIEIVHHAEYQIKPRHKRILDSICIDKAYLLEQYGVKSLEIDTRQNWTRRAENLAGLTALDKDVLFKINFPALKG